MVGQADPVQAPHPLGPRVSGNRYQALELGEVGMRGDGFCSLALVSVSEILYPKTLSVTG